MRSRPARRRAVAQRSRPVRPCRCRYRIHVRVATLRSRTIECHCRSTRSRERKMRRPLQAARSAFGPRNNARPWNSIRSCCPACSSPSSSRSTSCCRRSRSASRRYIALLEGLYLVTKRDVYLRLSVFWITIFAVSFGMGVVSGIVMPFQFGTNWSRYSDATAQRARPADRLRGADRVLPRSGVPRHPAVRPQAACRRGRISSPRSWWPPGTLFSSFWILAANSWMQTPRRPRDRRRALHAGRLVDDHLQSVVPVPPRAHGHAAST